METLEPGHVDIPALRGGRWSGQGHGVSSADLCDGGVGGAGGTGAVPRGAGRVRARSRRR